MRHRRLLGALVLSAAVTVIAACGDDTGGETTATFGSMLSTDASVTESAAPGTGGAATAVGGGAAGYVRVQLRLGASGADETIDLDRASVDAASLDPLGLDARCTAIDGGDGFVVSVVDLRRVSAGNRVVSASLRVDGEVTAAGAFEATLDVGDPRQVVTTYVGTVTLDAGLATGSFDMADATGQTATGTFACTDTAPDTPATTTTAAPTTSTIPEATS